ncbi:hypothetical protein [Reticulibacter mediterranei]|nr:hypothetical protein [Reticulibacter mediterranei]
MNEHVSWSGPGDHAHGRQSSRLRARWLRCLRSEGRLLHPSL